MAFQTAITIKEAIDNIHNNRYLLPAIQREFVWWPHQIERLFDSLMRGYPIGSFLFWRVDPDTAKNYSFYQFITNYDQRKPHNPVHGAPAAVPSLKAVLDGQQRLTALNVGLHGSGRWKLPRLWWNNPRAFPERWLHLNLRAPQMENEEEITSADSQRAQRRPGRLPRRHVDQSAHDYRGLSSLNEGRGVCPGDTSRQNGPEITRGKSLNEGRGVCPGDTKFNGGEHDR